jgi:hypothetical protein
MSPRNAGLGIVNGRGFGDQWRHRGQCHGFIATFAATSFGNKSLYSTTNAPVQSRNMVYASPAYARETFNAAGNALIGNDLQSLGVEQSLGIINCILTSGEPSDLHEAMRTEAAEHAELDGAVRRLLSVSHNEMRSWDEELTQASSKLPH